VMSTSWWRDVSTSLQPYNIESSCGCERYFNVVTTSRLDVLPTSTTWRYADVEFGCQHDINIRTTSRINALPTSTTRRCTDVEVGRRRDCNVCYNVVLDILITSTTWQYNDIIFFIINLISTSWRRRRLTSLIRRRPDVVTTSALVVEVISKSWRRRFPTSSHRRLHDVISTSEFGYQHDFNVETTSDFDVLATYIVRRCKDVVYTLSDVATYIQTLIDIVTTSCACWDIVSPMHGKILVWLSAWRTLHIRFEYHTSITVEYLQDCTKLYFDTVNDSQLSVVIPNTRNYVGNWYRSYTTLYRNWHHI